MNELTIGDKLLLIRQALGLSRQKTAEKISVPEHIIMHIERSPDSEPCGNDRHKILKFVQENEQHIKDHNEDWIARGIQKLQEDEARRKAMTHTFTTGRRYFISDSNADRGCGGDFNPMNGKGCIFIYLRKDGKHHIFREARGGWTRTYTDVQLMGKKIKEVEH